MIADRSRCAILVYAMLMVTTIALGTPTAFAANAEDAVLRHEGPWPIRNGHNYQPTEHELRALVRRMSRPIRRARSTDCTINSWQTAKKLTIDILHPHIDRGVG